MDDATLLATIYRGRPTTVSEIAALAHMDDDEAVEAVNRLQGLGLLGGDGVRVTYENPAQVVSDLVRTKASQIRRDTHRTLGDLERAVADLPRMIRHWVVGEDAGGLVPVTVRHGPTASEDFWYESADHDGGCLDAILPGLDRFSSADPERSARFQTALAKKDRVRVIVPTRSAYDLPAEEPQVDSSSAAVEYRLMDEPESWFWVDGDQLAVPFDWGESIPTSVVVVRSPALAGMGSAYFELLWRNATPLTPTTQPWTRLLVLMRQGTTLDTASRLVGINPRTGRRRIAAAMEYYGVSTLFALGVAFGADPSTRGGTGAAAVGA